jgi:hypothetical protein
MDLVDTQAGTPEAAGELATALPLTEDSTGATIETDAQTTETQDGEQQALPEGEEAEAQTTLHTVIVNGQERQVTTEELRKGFQKGEAAAQKWSEANKLRQEADAIRQQSEQLRQTYVQRLQELQMQSVARAEPPDWLKIQEADPLEFQRQQALWLQGRHPYQEAQAKAAQVRSEYIVEQRSRLFEVIPEWKDREIHTKEDREVTEYAISAGFSPEAVRAADDPIVIACVRKAMLWDRAQAEAKKPKLPVTKPQPVKPAPVQAATVPPSGRTTQAAQPASPWASMYPSMYNGKRS